MIAPGQVNDNLIDFTDFVPTLMDLAGVALPRTFVADGLSFYGQLVGQPDSVRAWIFSHYDARWNNHPFRRYAQDRGWKLYEDGAFYHIAEDPAEALPVADEDLTEELLQRKQRLQAVLDRLR